MPNRNDVSAGESYQVTVNQIQYDAMKFSDTEEAIAKEDYMRETTFYDDNMEPYSPFDDRDFQYFISAAEIAKKVHGGKVFAGSKPLSGQFGFRWVTIEDVTGGTAAGRTAGGVDREWGACATSSAVLGRDAWTAGRREWLGDGSQSGDANEFIQNEVTFDAGGTIMTKDSNDIPWVVIDFGVRTLALNSVIKSILAKIGGADIAEWIIEQHLRSKGRMAKRGIPIILTPTTAFKYGVQTEITAIENIALVAFAFIEYTRATQTTKTNCRLGS